MYSTVWSNSTPSSDVIAAAHKKYDFPTRIGKLHSSKENIDQKRFVCVGTNSISLHQSRRYPSVRYFQIFTRTNLPPCRVRLIKLIHFENRRSTLSVFGPLTNYQCPRVKSHHLAGSDASECERAFSVSAEFRAIFFTLECSRFSKTDVTGDSGDTFESQ